MQRSLIPFTTHDTGFIQYMDSGIWHLAIYNDGKGTETVSFLTTATGECFGYDLLLNTSCIAHNLDNTNQSDFTATSQTCDVSHPYFVQFSAAKESAG